MARVTRARVVQSASGARVFAPTLPSEARLRRMTRDEIDARDEASRLRKDAEESAAKILADARAEASNVATVAAKEAAQAEQAKLAAQLLALRAREQAFDESGVDRAVELARVLAERLVGEALTLDATTVAKLARQALLEARGARTVHIEANPEDVATLQEHLSRLTKTHVASVTADATIPRGSLRLRTDLGTIDAHLTPQLDRLAAALRDALR